MPYLDFIKPIELKVLLEKIKWWKAAYIWEFDMFKENISPTLKDFEGKVLNARFKTALDKTLEGMECRSTFEPQTNYGSNNSLIKRFRLRVSPSSQPKRDIYEFSVSFEIYTKEDGTLDLERADKDILDKLCQLAKITDECNALLTFKGRTFIAQSIHEWEKAIKAMQEINKDTQKYQALAYEFDLSRYK